MRWAGRRAATTTPTARTTRPPGWTGAWRTTERDLLRFTEALAGLRRDHPVFRRRRFFRGRRGPDDETSDIIWLTPAGQEMTQEDWEAGYAQSLAALLNGEAISEPDPRGGRIVDAKFLLLFNAHGARAHVHPARGQPGARLGGRDRHQDGGSQRRGDMESS